MKIKSKERESEEKEREKEWGEREEEWGEREKKEEIEFSAYSNVRKKTHIYNFHSTLSQSSNCRNIGNK